MYNSIVHHYYYFYLYYCASFSSQEHISREKLSVIKNKDIFHHKLMYHHLLFEGNLLSYFSSFCEQCRGWCQLVSHRIYIFRQYNAQNIALKCPIFHSRKCHFIEYRIDKYRRSPQIHKKIFVSNKLYLPFMITETYNIYSEAPIYAHREPR